MEAIKVITVPNCNGVERNILPRVSNLVVADLFEEYLGTRVRSVLVNLKEVPSSLWWSFQLLPGDEVFMCTGVKGCGPEIQKGSDRHFQYLLYLHREEMLKKDIKRMINKRWLIHGGVKPYQVVL